MICMLLRFELFSLLSRVYKFVQSFPPPVIIVTYKQTTHAYKHAQNTPYNSEDDNSEISTYVSYATKLWRTPSGKFIHSPLSIHPTKKMRQSPDTQSNLEEQFSDPLLLPQFRQFPV